MRLYQMLEMIDSCPAPVVCCVHGYALGGGSGLVACADIAVAWPDAVFGFSEVRLGIIPAVISPFVLAKIGAAAAAVLPHGRAVRRDGGAQDRACSGSFRGCGRGRRGNRRVAPRGRARSCREAKRLIRERPDGIETAHIAAARRTSAEGQEGLRAFLDRRKPSWSREA